MNWLYEWMMPPQGTLHAKAVDDLYVFTVLLSTFFFFLIAGLVLVFITKYKRRGPNDKVSQVNHNMRLEIAWSVIPLVIVIGIFFWGFAGYMAASVSPNDAMEIQVTAEKWLWSFEYPNGTRSIGDLHIPVGKPVKLVMMSKDVLHSFYIPAARIKADVLPDRYTEQWFQPIKAGMFQVQCTEYCGKGHSEMNARVFVDTPEKYLDFLEFGDEEMRKMPLSELGKLLYQTRGCATCHALDGTKGQGPSWKGVYGQDHQMSDGKSFKVDENYIRTSILQPQAMIVQGFEPIMPSYQGLLRDREIQGLIAYIKTLQ